MAFDARVVTNDPVPRLPPPRSPASEVAPAREDLVRPYVERGELVPVLEEFSAPFPASTLLPGAAAGLAGAPRVHRLPAPVEAEPGNRSPGCVVDREATGVMIL